MQSRTRVSSPTVRTRRRDPNYSRWMAGVDVVHMPYRGVAPALTDLLSGRVKLRPAFHRPPWPRRARPDSSLYPAESCAGGDSPIFSGGCLGRNSSERVRVMLRNPFA